MLVLSRKSNESIVIGDQIVIEILEISNNKIRIGIAAPSNVRVVRGELAPKAPVPGRVVSVTEKSHGGPTRAAASKSTAKSTPAQNSRLRNTGNNRPVNAPVNAPVKAQPLDQPVGRGLDRPLDRLRRSVVGGSGGGSVNPNVRTVADEARHRLRQLRQQIHQEVTGLDQVDSEPVGQEVAEPASPYQVRPLRQVSQRANQKSLQNSVSGSSDDRTAQQEVYWQVEALNQYRGEWVAEELGWYEASAATV